MSGSFAFALVPVRISAKPREQRASAELIVSPKQLGEHEGEQAFARGVPRRS
jgi:hypothetical protein